MQHIKDFISTIIPDINHSHLNTNWEMSQSWYMIDDALAFWYFSNLKDILVEHDINFNLYGWAYNKKIQVLNVEEFWKYISDFKHNPDADVLEKNMKKLFLESQTKSENNKYFTEATSIFSQHIDVYLKWNIIWDDFFQLIMQLLEYVDVFEIDYNDKRELVFVLKQARQVKTTKINIGNDTLPNWDDVNKSFDILLHKPVNKLSKSEFRYNNIMLLVKEVKDWFVDMRKHSLALKNKRGKYELHEYKIWEDIRIAIDTRDNKVISVEKGETEYETYKNESWIWMVWKPKDKTFKHIPTDDFTYHSVEFDQDKPYLSYINLFWAYTHVLRDILWFSPQTWQYKFLINQKRINYVAWVRRWGKTLLSSYLIIRFLYRQPSSNKHILRQPKWIYTITSKDKFKAVLDYIEAQSSRIKVLRSLVYVKKQERLILSDDKLDFAQNKYQEVQATYDFTSAKWYKTWVGNGWDDLIIDEASTIPEDVWLNLAPIVTNEKANLFCISTIDWTTPKQWFYANLVQAERWILKNTYAQRVTIDDIDSNIMDEDSKDHAKSILSHNMARYLWELYATFSSESQVFSSEGSIYLENPKDRFEEIIIWYDPAKRSDFWAVIVCWVLKWTLYLLEEYQLQWDYSNYQKWVLFEIKERRMKENYKTTLIMDGTAAWDIVAEILWNIVDYKVWYTWDTSSKYKPHVDDFGSWKVSKTRLVTTTQILFETKRIKINSNLVKLQWEIQTFKSYVSASWHFKFDAISWEHDDLVNAMMMVWFYYWYIDWKISYLSKDNDKQYKSILGSYINHKTWRYKEYFKTIKTKQQRKQVNTNRNKEKNSWYKI